MDKPRHPLVIRPWKTRPAKPPLGNPQRLHRDSDTRQNRSLESKKHKKPAQ